ncbi:efflux RND transporter permease subunit [Aureispira anguillae]|uniref:Efflux RND transporter permease subunit n=1 Tax=Aureispira anguillae TaxID=2864201 RepID=A0A915VJZ5_9BACT|nr:efflux RND transporter permease subunit [Aureispira anguillae]BDS09432.1 efflux RND transporter permease subunit [Aureispira anguillae]
MLDKIIRFFLENRLITLLLLGLIIAWGIVTMPFDINKGFLPNDPVSVDAIPDIGENQQIVFTTWMGRSPQDIEDQITYPLTTALLGIPGVRTIRSNSMFGFSSIYIIFEEDVAFYWSRSRILEKLNSLPSDLLPNGVQPSLGPDATALGQIYWYTLEGRGKEGKATGGWDPQELRSIQDFYVKYGLSAASGVAEVASIGGYVKEYQVDVDPQKLLAYEVSLQQVVQAVKSSNIDIGAQTLEINRAEYFVRGLGYVKSIQDIEQSVIKVHDNKPVRVKDIGRVALGPAVRRGVLDKNGGEAVGGVVVARYGANPLEVINNVKARIQELENGLPSKTLADGTVSKVHIVPFYDRSHLIKETIGTLQEALTLEILITIIVIIILLLNLRASILVSSVLPIAVLMCFIVMRYLGVDANVVALSGIAIAIGTMVDMGIVLAENIVENIEKAAPNENKIETIFRATKEVASAIITAVATTIISFLPIFTMIAAEGKLFRPLAMTKTIALLASIILTITVLPTFAYWFLGKKGNDQKKRWQAVFNISLLALGLLAFSYHKLMIAGIAIAVGGIESIFFFREYLKPQWRERLVYGKNFIYAGILTYFLAIEWMPLGVAHSEISNFLLVAVLISLILGLFQFVIYTYPKVLMYCLEHKLLFMLLPLVVIILGGRAYQQTQSEFMPSLDEGAFLLMPTTMPHAGMEENQEVIKILDMAVAAIPEVDNVVGKAGRVASALDPAPMSMFENVINYKSEYKTDEEGHRLRFKVNTQGDFVRDKNGQLIPDAQGQYFRQWRAHIQSPDDIWAEITRVAQLPGLTPAPKLQPIETRLVMLQTGMRAPIGIKIKGPDLATIQQFGLELEHHLKAVEGVKAEAVFADRIVGKPYLEINFDRTKMARYGLKISEVQQYVQVAIGGIPLTQTVEGRERYAIRVRYPRDFRKDPNVIQELLIPVLGGGQVPLADIATLHYQQGPQAIKSEDGFLTGYVLLDKKKGYSETAVVEQAQAYLNDKIEKGLIEVPTGISYRFAGNYENQVRANQRLAIVIPLALLCIFLILYLQFNSVALSLMVFMGVIIAFSGGFMLIGFYQEDWFLNLEIGGINWRTLFQINPINLSVAVWVGFLALFGIATDDGVLVGTYLQQSFKNHQPKSVEEIRSAVLEAGSKRVRPAMMTTATTILALLPVLTSSGRGADIMIPMAIPSFGGMLIQMITMFTVPVLYCTWAEIKLFWNNYKTNKQ